MLTEIKSKKREDLCEYYWNRDKFKYVKIVEKDGQFSSGILIEKTPGFLLVIKDNKRRSWDVDPLNIRRVYKADDEKRHKGGDDHFQS